MRFLSITLVLTINCIYAFLHTKWISNVKSITSLQALDVGDFDDTKFEEVERITDKLGLFKLDATVHKDDMKQMLEEYKAEMKKRKVSFPGFRPGALPPYVMVDVRKYIVCYALESMLGTLCNINSLAMCGIEGEEVQFGEDDYYREIITTDANGRDFDAQRESWREGTDFSFGAQFYAKIEDSDNADETDDANETNDDVIDVEEAADK